MKERRAACGDLPKSNVNPWMMSVDEDSRSTTDRRLFFVDRQRAGVGD